MYDGKCLQQEEHQGTVFLVMLEEHQDIGFSAVLEHHQGIGFSKSVMGGSIGFLVILDVSLDTSVSLVF